MADKKSDNLRLLRIYQEKGQSIGGTMLDLAIAEIERLRHEVEVWKGIAAGERKGQ